MVNINNVCKSKLNPLRSICVLFYFSFVCMSAYANVYFKTICECIRPSICIGPRSSAGVPFDSVRRFWATLLMRTSCMRLWGNWVASCVAALQTKNQKPYYTDFEIWFSVLIEMFVTWISFRGTFQSFWDLSEVSAQSWYKVRTYDLVNPTFKISLIDWFFYIDWLFLHFYLCAFLLYWARWLCGFQAQKKIEIQFSVLIEMFVMSIRFRGTLNHFGTSLTRR